MRYTTELSDKVYHFIFPVLRTKCTNLVIRSQLTRMAFSDHKNYNENKKPLSLPPFTTMLGYVGNILSSWFQKKSPGKVPIYDFEDLSTSSVCLYDDKGLLVAFRSRKNQLRWPKAERGNLTHKLHLRRTKVGRRNLVERRGKSTGRPTLLNRTGKPSVLMSQSQLGGLLRGQMIPRDPEWDGWPDGDFSALFSMSFVEKHDNLHVHWATKILGGRAVDTDAAVWKDGKLTRRQCQGIIQCECRLFCGHPPSTRKAGVENQLSKLCIWGLDLSILLASGGVYHQNGGTHDHPRPTVRLHLAKEERDEFAAIVREQPKTGPLKLVVGRPTASGPAQVTRFKMYTTDWDVICPKRAIMSISTSSRFHNSWDTHPRRGFIKI
ncbi:hypothetical protein B0H14DRAFT_2592431 [Mycena olivaceomarginata]|nr:hypothetical protein B0H14DRAFT_2592431 [Mycena olivaceomarginata]